MVAAADGSLTGQMPGGDTLRVREVWQDNLEQEMKVRGLDMHGLVPLCSLHQDECFAGSAFP